MKKTVKSILLGCIVILAFILYCNIRVVWFSSRRVFDDLSTVPRTHAALLLGAPPVTGSGSANAYFTHRIDACAELYRAGKVDVILVSGDNRDSRHNETDAARKALTEKGIPESALLVDEAGYRTLESVVRARDVFGLSSFVIVSQRFHNERAVFLAARSGVDAIGYNAPDAGADYGPRVILREYLARCRVFWDLLAVSPPAPAGEEARPALQEGWP